MSWSHSIIAPVFANWSISSARPAEVMRRYIAAAATATPGMFGSRSLDATRTTLMAYKLHIPPNVPVKTFWQRLELVHLRSSPRMVRKWRHEKKRPR
jgi:hypothetical protein